MTTTADPSFPFDTETTTDRKSGWRERISHHPTVFAGILVLATLGLLAVAAPYLGTFDPVKIHPMDRLEPPSAVHWFGTDHLGRDLYSRVIYGGRISLIVGLVVMVLSTAVGLAIGLVTGFVRWIDAVVMRVMDGIMAIPAILLAIALMALTEASVKNVIMAITVVEIPRVVRLVRSVVLSVREQPFVEAATAVGTSFWMTLIRHVLPNTVAPLVVQATYVAAHAILTEAVLSFLGAGTPPVVPSWGNIIAEGRSLIQVAPWMLLLPGLFLTITVLAVNLLGDGLRDSLDPRMKRRL